MRSKDLVPLAKAGLANIPEETVKAIVDPLIPTSKPRRDSSLAAWLNVIYRCLKRRTLHLLCGFSCAWSSGVGSVDAIRTELVSIAEQGYRKIVLFGQNIDAHGRDMNLKRTFDELLRFLHHVPRTTRGEFKFTVAIALLYFDELVTYLRGFEY
jgi:tRNA A37 methylthiotransferase MiaB